MILVYMGVAQIHKAVGFVKGFQDSPYEED